MSTMLMQLEDLRKDLEVCARKAERLPEASDETTKILTVCLRQSIDAVVQEVETLTVYARSVP